MIAITGCPVKVFVSTEATPTEITLFGAETCSDCGEVLASHRFVPKVSVLPGRAFAVAPERDPIALDLWARPRQVAGK